MNPDDPFYQEYPKAVWFKETRLPFSFETSFSRVFKAPGEKSTFQISRFSDGSATMSAAQLTLEWPSWNKEKRLDFVGNMQHLKEQPDFPEMIQIVIAEGDPDLISSSALEIAAIGQSRAYPLLLNYLDKAAPGDGANLNQAIARTGHPEAVSTLYKRLDCLRANPSLWSGEGFTNSVAHEFVCCIRDLLEVGADSATFATDYQNFLNHPHEMIRECTINFLTKYYEGKLLP